ncbi:P2X purinoceptor 7-like [Rana temporaria]|uniref:P2X purinoceptor 7-like n=1 Tax=Rana temporaria TaxID=8407 RepID=UPI001AAC9BC6|nr:P2X purinoceptor 7-like [Rana temporaria]XP_040191768.1 P2X purinoceptor 7-like [Rana temporaria]
MENTQRPKRCKSMTYRALSQEERRSIIVAELLDSYANNSNVQAFQDDPRAPITVLPYSASQTDDSPTDKIGNTDWCICESCGPMPTQLESVCCRQIYQVEGSIPEGMSCITAAPVFVSQFTIQEHVYITSMAIHVIERPVVDADNNRRLRKTAYRAFIGWIYGFLGKANRKVIPACVVKAIREAFPDPDGSYVGFMYSDDYEASEMAFH